MHLSSKHDDVTIPANQPGLLAPDTSGMNFYRADPALTDLRGDARRLLLSRMVIDHRVLANDPFRLTENSAQREMSGHLLGERAVGMAEVGELLIAA
jgi:hypothetical protein